MFETLFQRFWRCHQIFTFSTIVTNWIISWFATWIIQYLNWWVTIDSCAYKYYFFQVMIIRKNWCTAGVWIWLQCLLIIMLFVTIQKLVTIHTATLFTIFTINITTDFPYNQNRSWNRLCVRLWLHICWPIFFGSFSSIDVLKSCVMVSIIYFF